MVLYLRGKFSKEDLEIAKREASSNFKLKEAGLFNQKRDEGNIFDKLEVKGEFTKEQVEQFIESLKHQINFHFVLAIGTGFYISKHITN